MSKIKRNTKGLLQYAEMRRVEAEKKANAAIDDMKRKNKQINFKTVAEISGVSKATLYKNDKIRARIESLRAVKKEKIVSKNKEREMISRENDLRRQIQLLKEEKKMLIAQLVEMDAIMQENQQLRKTIGISKLE